MHGMMTKTGRNKSRVTTSAAGYFLYVYHFERIRKFACPFIQDRKYPDREEVIELRVCVATNL